MDYFDRVEKAIKYIEENLKEKIYLADVADAACFSKYHFHRIFHAMTGGTVNDYIRRRRLTKASFDLIEKDDSILAIAIDYQFESQAAFSRAFKNIYGMAPRAYRNNKIHCSVLTKRKLTAVTLKHLQGGITMKPDIIEMKEFKVVGMRGSSTLKDNKVPELWAAFAERMHEIKNRPKPNESFGICEYQPDFHPNEFNDETVFTELVCVEVDNFDEVPDGMVKKVIPAGNFARFSHKGNVYKLRETYDYIYGTWLPRSGQKIRLADDFELYGERFRGPMDDSSEIDIYIPLQ